jgi:hypothetical protein
VNAPDIDVEKWTHRAGPLLIAAVILTAPTILLPDNWWGRLVNTVTVLPLIALVCLNLYHGKRFCEYCAAATPADGVGAARRKSRTLKFFHRCISPWALVYLVAMLTVPNLLPRVWPYAIAWAVFQPGLLFFLWALRVHNLLEPWCPWCNGDDGRGLREPSPDPVIPQKV